MVGRRLQRPPLVFYLLGVLVPTNSRARPGPEFVFGKSRGARPQPLANLVWGMFRMCGQVGKSGVGPEHIIAADLRKLA